MPRYEFSEGSSNKFWQIDLSGTSFTTTYGKIGASGSTTIKTFKTDAEAKKEYDKLVAEKVKKGYELADASEEDDEEEEQEAPKPAAKPAAKPATSSGTKATPRYFEFSEGTSNKFWEIRLDGDSVRTRYGKIGTTGQQTLKDFANAAAANKEYDKLVHEKTRKGYEETAAPGGGDDDDDDED